MTEISQKSTEPLIQALLYAAGFFIVHKLAHKVLPVPASIEEIQDPEKKKKDEDDYYSSYPSILFGVTISLWSFHSIMNHGTTFGQPTIPAFQGPMILAYGYFINELLQGFLAGRLDLNFLFHHISSLVYAALVCHSGMNGSESVKGMVMCEVTNPLYNFTVILKAYKKETLRKVFGLIFIALFLSLRIFPLYQILIGYQLNSGNGSLISIFPTIIWFVSMSWVWDMINKVAKLIAEAFPKAGFAQTPYKAMKRIRKYKAVYLVVVGYVSIHHLLVKYIDKSWFDGGQVVAGQVGV